MLHSHTSRKGSQSTVSFSWAEGISLPVRLCGDTMAKERTSISVDPDVYQFLQQPEINQSQLIQELVREYRENEERQVAALKLRLRQLKEDAESLEQRAKNKRQQAEEVAALLDDAKEAESEQLQEAREAMSGLNLEEINSDNPAIENWANKLDMEPTSLIDRLLEDSHVQ